MGVVKIERVYKVTTPEEDDREWIEYYRKLTPNERLAHLFQLLDESIPEDQRRVQRTYRIVSVPKR